jgi:serine/threonine-protein kinase
MLRAETGGESSPLILDFGLARALDRDPRQGASSSSPTLVGTFDYIAPEQLEGKPHSRASDVYAFGIVLFEMLTGELPFESNSSPAIAALERLQKAAPAPSTKNPLVPSDLDELVLGCLRRSPKERYRTPAEVLTALDALESRRRSRFQKRRLVPLALGAALGGLGMSLALSAPTKKPEVAVVARTLSAATPAPRSPIAVVVSAAARAAAHAPVPPPEPGPPKRAPVTRHQLTAAAPPVPSNTPDPPPQTGPPAPSPDTTKKPAGWEDPFGSSRPGDLVVNLHPS